MTKPLPCPFCNTEGYGDIQVTFSQTRVGGWSVRCYGCLAIGPDESTESEAIAKWNAAPRKEPKS